MPNKPSEADKAFYDTDLLAAREQSRDLLGVGMGAEAIVDAIYRVEQLRRHREGPA